jgi:peptidoglycan/LPS O-acetylase OafA/YrhL
MIVSGFVIAHLLITRPEPYSVYLRRRVFRLFPIYLVCLALALLLEPAQLALHSAPWVSQAERWHAGFYEQSQHFGTHLALHLTLLHGMVPDTVLPFAAWTILGPAWSLSLEWQFYLLAPAIVSCIRKSLISCILTVTVLLGIMALLLKGVAGTWAFPSMVLLAIPYFLIGIFSRILFLRISALPVWVTIAVGLAAAYVLRDIRYVLCTWTFFMVAMRFESTHDGNLLVRAIQWVAANRVVTTLGKVSYSTYLIHVLVLSLLVQVLALLHGSFTAGIARQAAIVTLVLLPGISLLLYHYIERPFIRLGARHLGRKRETAPRALADAPATAE